MSGCGEVEILLQDYLDGYLLVSQRERLEGHLEQCAGCRRLVSSLGLLESSLGAAAELDVDPPADLSGRILSSLPERRDRRNHFRLFGGPLAAAAMLLVGLFSGFYAGTGPDAEMREIEIVFHAPEARSVSLVGEFNGWDPERSVMRRGLDDDLWRARVKLPPGVYEYGFMIDGAQWSKDPLARATLDDGFGGENSLLFVES